MGDAVLWHRVQFAFTIAYHYLFPQLTMGLAFLIVLLKVRAYRSGAAVDQSLARFWVKVFGINFAIGVVTGIPMEFQLGTNWARFSNFAGGVIGTTLAMEGLFAFFLESSFLAMLVWGEQKLGPKKHLFASIALWVGSWLSGFFIVTTNAFMQHPVGYDIAANGKLALTDVWAFLFNPWAWVQYLHTMLASVLTASFVVSAVGAFWLLRGTHLEEAKKTLRLGVRAGLVAALLVAFPSGDLHAKTVARFQPVALAAMEGRFESGPQAEIHLIGQPNVAARRMDNGISVPAVLSFLAYGHFGSNVKGLLEFSESEWPTNIELLYYAFHVMVGLGTLFIALMGLSALLDWRHRLSTLRPLLWVLLLAFPFPYIATTAGWVTAELGRQPYVVYGLMRTADATSAQVHTGSTLFSALGFAGLYTVFSGLFVFLMFRTIARGPDMTHAGSHPEHP